MLKRDPQGYSEQAELVPIPIFPIRERHQSAAAALRVVHQMDPNGREITTGLRTRAEDLVVEGLADLEDKMDQGEDYGIGVTVAMAAMVETVVMGVMVGMVEEMTTMNAVLDESVKRSRSANVKKSRAL